MSHHPYPAVLPTECLTTVISLIRNRQVADQPAEFANCLWTMVGFGLKLGFGDPDAHEEKFGAADVPSDKELNECHAALASYEDDGPSFAAAEGEQAIDPATIVVLVQLVMQIIEFLRNRKKK
jgi:hypothetical protein